MEEYKEIKELRKQISENEDSAIKLLKENVELKSIIKEVKEWEKDLNYECISGSKHNKLLEILDKVNK